MADASSSQYRQSAEWYDRIYSHIGKDYRAEADVVDGIIRARCPSANSLLDVGCGTGLHLEHFASMYDDVVGLDLDTGFVVRAQKRGCNAVVGDMRSFNLDRKFDAVTCLFSAVGHVGEADDLDAAIACMAAHLVPGGVLVVEPWILSEDWIDGKYGVEIAEGSGSTLIRVNHSMSDGNVSVCNFAWTECTSSGIQRMDEVLRLTRYTHDEYKRAFERAHLTAYFDASGCNAGRRGLWIGT